MPSSKKASYMTPGAHSKSILQTRAEESTSKLISAKAKQDLTSTMKPDCGSIYRKAGHSTPSSKQEKLSKHTMITGQRVSLGKQ